jgi:hypothetical protein
MAKELALDEIDENTPDGPNQLRQFAERAAAKGARADALERELAAVQVGIDVASRVGPGWLQGFGGDFSDSAAVLADATEFSPTIIKGAAPVAAEVQAAEGAGDVAQTTTTEAAQRTALADGALPSGAAEQDVATLSLDMARKAIDQGGTVAEAMGGLVQMRAQAVNEGRMQPLLPNGQRPPQR